MSNYRPISLLFTFSKIFEKLMHKQLANVVELKGFLSSRQYGFRLGHSSEDAFALLSVFMNKIMDRSKIPMSILSARKMAFDCVSHDIFLDRLDHSRPKASFFIVSKLSKL